MPRAAALAAISSYFEAFNRGDTTAMEALVTEDFEHHVNEGNIRRGVEKFREFNAHMTRCYREELTDIVVMANDAGTRAAAEFVVNGAYIATDEGLPEAKGQTYVLPAGTFFTLRDGRIARVTTYYNLADWIRQVGG
ncbi:isopropylmalate/homocitrate/citramalate synthase [Rhodobacter sp. TJ_12]|uniref:ketosteroid isomerase-related protein n=1 Tax=Rhodobacter sp. TJ_12 TaxID=2029399 RepID=UPI001CBBF92D|nr:ketosteroid isomerase-related protein [Rhodobacter sp. TJ_12]MBZ4023395.1 isopropylmalate/homocitrate/citramalate synthase [Rhodobacter sp. TJ_12]